MLFTLWRHHKTDFSSKYSGEEPCFIFGVNSEDCARLTFLGLKECGSSSESSIVAQPETYLAMDKWIKIMKHLY